MRISVIALFAAALALPSGMCAAQLLDQADAPNRLPPTLEERVPPRIVFDRDRHDFGLIMDTEKAETEFVFVNEGPGLLRIENAKGSCNCTVPALSKTQFKPGESGTIKVVYDPKNRAGDQHQTVTVTTNDPERRTVQLVVAAKVRPSVIIEPRMAHFGPVAKDTPSELTIRIAGRTADFKVLEAVSDNPDVFTITLGKSEPFKFEEEPEPLPTTTLTVKMRPGAPIGLIRNYHARIRTNDPKNEQLQVELLAQHLGDIEVLPERVSFGAVRIGDTFEQEVVIRSRTGTPFTILDVEDRNPDPNAVKITLAPQAPNGGSKAPAYVLRISGQIGENGRGVRGLLIVHTDVEREQSMSVPYFASVRRN